MVMSSTKVRTVRSRAVRTKPKASTKAARVFRYLLRCLLLLLLAFIGWVIYIQWQVHSVPHSPLPPAADTAIVLGASLRHDVPSPGLQERLDHAVQLYRDGKFKQFIVSGGLDHNGSKLTEAEGMQLYLIKQGIAKKHIWLENEATSTYENLLFSKRIMSEQGFVSAIIVTHDFHGARSMDIARTLDIKQVAISTTGSKVLFMPYHEARETLAYSKWELTKLLLRIGIVSKPS
jgi:uncharacterized SAM-binding protein YcdF (DUF218 family)